MEPTKQIDVMVADASHEVYVDTILDTIREAAKVRGTGIAERTHEYVATKMKEGKAIIALCGDDFAGFTYIGQAYQTRFVHPGPPTMAESQDFQSDFRSRRDENEYGTGLCAGHLQ